MDGFTGSSLTLSIVRAGLFFAVIIVKVYDCIVFAQHLLLHFAVYGVRRPPARSPACSCWAPATPSSRLTSRRSGSLSRPPCSTSCVKKIAFECSLTEPSFIAVVSGYRKNNPKKFNIETLLSCVVSFRLALVGIGPFPQFASNK